MTADSHDANTQWIVYEFTQHLQHDRYDFNRTHVTLATTAIRLLNLNRLVLSLSDPYFRISSASGMGFGGVYAMCIPAAFAMTRGIFHIGGTCHAMVLRRDRCARA